MIIEQDSRGLTIVRLDYRAIRCVWAWNLSSMILRYADARGQPVTVQNFC
jgi:hypothetical protein